MADTAVETLTAELELPAGVDVALDALVALDVGGLGVVLSGATAPSALQAMATTPAAVATIALKAPRLVNLPASIATIPSKRRIGDGIVVRKRLLVKARVGPA